MTSTFLLSKRSQINFVPTYDPNAPLGGMEDHYIRTQGDCHPDFEAIPINKASGAKFCRRIRYEMQTHDDLMAPIKNGIYTNNRQLYQYGDEENRRWNNIQVEKRVTPNESWLYERDYFRPGAQFNGTGFQKRPANSHFGKPVMCVEIGRNDPK